MKLHDDEDGQYSFYCPGCKSRHVVTTIEPFSNGAKWAWNGSMDKPTFQPSYLLTSDQWTPPVTYENLAAFRANPWPQTKKPYICHSFITDGQIRFLEDSTHALAGQTVELPEWK